MADESFLHLVRKDCPVPQGTHLVAYCRDSGGEEQDRSVKQQEQAITEYCTHHGLILERVYIDEAKVSSNTGKRLALNTMLEDISLRFPLIRDRQKRAAQKLERPFATIFWKSNRLGRDRQDTTLIKADLGVRGVTVINLLAKNVTGNELIDSILDILQQDQDESLLDEISDNSKRGLAELVSLRDTNLQFRAANPDWPTNDGNYLGIVPGGLPTGFKSEKILIGVRERKGRKHGGQRHYVQRMVPNHDDNEWERCFLAWKMRIEGAPIKQIMEATRLYKSVGCYSSFFKNRIYTGDLEFGEKLYQKFVPALIPIEWWDEEQRRREARGAKLRKARMEPNHEPRRVGSRHLLTGLVYCGAKDGEEHPMLCDTVPERKGKRSRWDFYICSHKKNSRESTCQAGRVGAAALDQAVIEALKSNVLTKENLRPIAEALSKARQEVKHQVSERIELLAGELRKKQKAIDNILDAIEDNRNSESLKVRLAERESEKRKLEAELVSLESQIVKRKDNSRISEQDLEKWINDIHRTLESDDIDQIRKVIRQFVGKIVVNAKTGSIHYTFPLSPLSRIQEVVPTGVHHKIRTLNLAA